MVLGGDNRSRSFLRWLKGGRASMALTLEPRAKRNNIFVKRKPSVDRARTDARHQASTGGRPMMIMALMVAPTLEPATLKSKPADGGRATRA